MAAGLPAIAWASALWLLAAASVPAAPADRRGELKDLQGRIQALQKEIGQAEESRSEATEELRETERAISDAGRSLRELAAERGEVQAALARLEAQARQLTERIALQQAQIGRLLRRQYMAGEPDALRLLASGADPNQVTRDAHYLALLSRAKLELVRGLDAALTDKRRLAEGARDKNAALAEIEKRQGVERAALLEQRKKRQATLARLGERIKAQRREVEKLKRDEKRLARLIEGLRRIVPPVAKRPAGAAPGLRNERTPEPAAAADAFARLKGRLRLPVRGELANRFGTPRSEGGTAWKGLFIRAPGGAEVKAIAPGRVVFADWLRGFGNLVIVDHGEGYLSVYGNNESLFKAAGQPVAAGEAIAAVGDSGGNAETGLYFELRHLGQALDPLKWVSLK